MVISDRLTYPDLFAALEKVSIQLGRKVAAMIYSSKELAKRVKTSVPLAYPVPHVDREKAGSVEFPYGRVRWASRGSAPPSAVIPGWDAGDRPILGIIIRMFAEPAAPHHRPHLHAYYQDEVGIFAIDTLELIGGDLHQQQRRLVEAWGEIHRSELLAAWDRLQAGKPPGKIEPLR